tara:strand:+ start:1401 stop:3818 length:2418 start_codon:yes stop_codon:yes gene_type:complete
MATPTIPNGEEYFFPIIYEGNGAGQRVGKFVPFTDSGTIANSLIFNDGDSPYMRRTPSGAGNRKTFTVSFWVKRCQLGVLQIICTQGADHNNATVISFDTSNRFKFSHNDSGSATYTVTSNRTFEDTSKFYHLLASVDTTQSTASDRVKLYVDGDLITSFASSSYPSQDFDLDFNSTGTIAVSGQIPSGTLFPFDGYLTEINLVDGSALTPDTFGLTDTSTGRWIPKALTGITYGTNGFRLQFGSSSALGDDTSGNNHDFSVTNLVAGDQTTDSPTQNHATLAVNGPNVSSSFSEGNLKATFPTSSAMTGGLSTLKMVSGKYYMEATVDSISSAGLVLGIMGSDRYTATNEFTGRRFDAYGYYSVDGKLFNNYDGNSTSFTFGNSYTTSDVIGIAVDLDNDKLYFSKNGTFQNSANPSAGTGGHSIISAKSTTAGFYRFCLTDGGTGSTDIVTANFGQKSFTYTPPTSFVALQQDNLPETSKGVSGFVWIKERTASSNHQIYDSSRGAGKLIMSSSTNAESTRTDALYKFLKGGYAVGDNSSINGSGDSVVAWNWVANVGNTASNGNGSITSTVQVNQTAGFSIVEFTTPSTTQDFTVGHGLSVAPRVFFFKRLDSTSGWAFYHQDVFDANGNQYTLFLNTTAASAAPNPGTAMYPSATTATTFSLRAGASIASSANCVAYCFNEVDGYSKFGKYTGNGNADGTFVYTGFRPAWLMIKSTGSANWYIIDTKRDPINPTGQHNINADTTSAESSNAGLASLDILSNGFKNRQGAGTGINNSGQAYIYMAFAEHPFVGDGTNPVTAR